MKTILKISIVFIFILLFSCKKEETYTGSVIFWYDSSMSDFFVNDGAVSLTFYVNNQIVGSTATSVYWNSEPNCGQNATITHEQELGENKSQTYTYKIKDQRNHTYVEDIININADRCLIVKLTD